MARFMAALAASYPTLQRMLGDDSFVEVARGFFAMDARLTVSARLPDFLRTMTGAANAGYLADIAALDLAVLRVLRDSSTVLLRSQYPVVSAWRANQAGGDGFVGHWRAETALVARTDRDVEIWTVPPGSCATSCGGRSAWRGQYRSQMPPPDRGRGCLP